jgi:hypothetical protein
MGSAKSPFLVTLNLFQGLLCCQSGLSRRAANCEVSSRKPSSGCAEKWVLKHVQDDEKRGCSEYAIARPLTRRGFS